ncbi:MAG TPA: hypothetical protein VFJ58_20965 [Armatimonadota bacterium]|nr:hypothetical protein [Armatimonadota bacterium]
MRTRTKKELNPRRLWFGPGALLALGGAVALVASGWLASPQPGVNAGRLVYEADAHGQMRRVDPSLPRTASAPKPLPPLWKPEPAWLLKQSTRLGLTAPQMKKMSALQTSWQQVKRGLQHDMAEIAARTLHPEKGNSRIPLAAVQQGMAGYSELSREYDAQRSGAWVQGLSLLSGGQRRMVIQLESSSQGRGRPS